MHGLKKLGLVIVSQYFASVIRQVNSQVIYPQCTHVIMQTVSSYRYWVFKNLASIRRASATLALICTVYSVLLVRDYQ